MSALLRPLTLVLLLSTAAACGDDTGPSGAPDAGPSGGGEDAGPDGGGSGVTCDTEISVADLEGGSWDTRFTVPGFTGHDGIAPIVHDFAIDTDGSLIAAGTFQYYGGERVPPLMRLRDGVWEPARDTWEIPPPPTGFGAIAISEDGVLALATADDFGERKGEIWIDDGSGLRSVGGFEGQVRTLAWYGGLLWVAGTFAMQDATIIGLATWDGTSWSAAPGGAINGFAFELVPDGDELLVGGEFNAVGGIEAQAVAAYDGTSWRALDLPGARVYALVRGEDGELYAGGVLGELEPGTGGIARWDGSAWQPVGGGLAMWGWPGVVTDLVAHDGAVHATGCFNAAGGTPGSPQAVQAIGALARWDGTAWNNYPGDGEPLVAPWIQPFVCGDEGPTAIFDVPMQRLAVSGDLLFAGGALPGAGGVQSQAIVAFDGISWIAQGPPGLGIAGSLDRVAIAGDTCELYAFGTFTHVGGVPATSRVVRFDGEAWHAVAVELPPSVDVCPAFAASRAGEVALGCIGFNEEQARPVGLLYRGRGDALELVPVDVGPINDLAYDDQGRLWIAGGAETGYVARLDGDTLTEIEDGFDAVVTKVVVSGDEVIAAGMFVHVGAVAAVQIARWDGEAWSPLGDGLPGYVVSVARDAGGTVYASTYDLSGTGTGYYLLAAFDGDSWTELATPEAGITAQPHFTFDVLEPIDGGLLAVGSAQMDEGGGRGAFVYRDGRFEPLGGGVGGVNVTGLAVSSEAVWFAGWIAEVGAAGPSPVSTVGVARYQLAPR